LSNSFAIAQHYSRSEKKMKPNQPAPETLLPPVRFDIPQDILDPARLNVDDMKLELAVALYAQPGRVR
jgi:hypothetical protein